MNYDLTQEQNEIKVKIAAFCKNDIEPVAETLDAASFEDANIMMKRNLKKLADTGYLGLMHDRKYGGGNFDYISQAVAGEELAKGCPSTALSANASAIMFGLPMDRYGTDAQKAKYIKGVVNGEIIGGYAITEQGAGSDVAAMTARAEKKGDKWIINGTKTFVTNAPIADAFLVFVYTDNNAGPAAGITCFIVDKGAPGMSAGKPVDKMGFRGSPTAELNFTNCEVGPDAVLGKTGGGYQIIQDIQEYGKLGMAVISCGIGGRCLELANQYSKKREAFGKPINRYQEIAFKLAEMMIFIDVSRLLIYKAAWLKEINDPEAPVLSSCAKAFAGEYTTLLSNLALQVYGGHGYIKGNPIERLYRDAKLGDIIEGTTETQRMAIAKDVLEKFAK
ncbi:MAG: acyl-CoA dehydrogenase family protein [Spirochaetes bacterium]|jgi:butyryl-CoA dehydrogenase|nr:acyl-CoA dehydrogenase family protein [Spirochaetota bacterium]